MKAQKIVGLWGLLLLTSCGLPLNKMTPAERKADMQWAFSIFQHNYAPADLKKEMHQVELQAVEAECLALAEEDMENQEFLALFQKCVRRFKDAHVGAQQMNNGLLPEYAKVAHLGFLTERTKWIREGEVLEALRITKALVGADNAGAPLIPGDLIVGINDQELDRYLINEIVPYSDVGQRETNLSLAGLRFGVRTSIDMALPTEDEIRLEVVRNGQLFNIDLPWIYEDMLDFQLKQSPPEEADPDFTPPAEEQTLTQNLQSLELQTPPLALGFLGYAELAQMFNSLGNPAEFVSQRVRHLLHTSFQRMQFNPIMSALLQGPQADQDNPFSTGRRLFPSATKVDDLMVEPAFIAKVVTLESGQSYAYIKLDSFPAEDKILTEWYRAITAIEDKGLKGLVIDLVDNSGGSLIHGMRMLNLLRQRTIQFPSLQVRLNNNWMNAFKSQAAFGTDDYSKAIARRVLRDLEEDRQQGKALSRPLSVRVLDNFFLQNPSYGLKEDVQVAVLVNEFCVSMCDIFASVIQDNKLGTLVGQRTMGGGGNVVQHGLSPVSKMGLALTESLILSPKGVYLENQGVIPEVLVDMVADREAGFQEALRQAQRLLFPTLEAEPDPSAGDLPEAVDPG